MTTSRKALMSLLPVGIIIALVIGGLYLVKAKFIHQGANGGGSLHIGSSLPDFSAQQVGGKPIKISGLGAKVVFVNFWATWCEACMIEMPSIIRLRNKYKPRGFEVLAVNMDDNPEAAVPRALRAFSMPFPVYKDTNSELTELFDVHAIPFSVMIKVTPQDRKVVFIETGERKWDDKEMNDLMERWLSE